MEVGCPNCSSKFNLPDKLAKPGAKLRCAVCKTVFQLPGAQESRPAPKPTPKASSKSGALPEMAAPKKSRLKTWLLFAFLAAVLAGGGTWFWMRMDEQKAAAPDIAPNVELLTMRNVRQYNVLNEKLGKVFVIEGRVVNEFPGPKEMIELEGAIYDKDKKPLAVKRQLAGTQLSLFQLQVLSEKEMESFLNNRVELLANNSNVQPGGEVPFMILFYNPPGNVAEFGVKIIDVKDVARS